MIDVRLAATNPEDSTLVPVSCNSRGELATVAPKIEEIPNDLKIEGDLTVTGLINGSDGVGEPGPPGPPGEPGGQGPQGEKGDPGIGVPLPYGAEGSYLGIIDGVPQWNIPVGPGPDPEPPEGVIWANIAEVANIVNEQGDVVVPPDPMAYLKAMDSWGNTDSNQPPGSYPVYKNVGDEGTPWSFEFENMFGKVLTFYWVFEYNNDYGYDTDWTSEQRWSDPQINMIARSGEGVPTTSTSPTWCYPQFSFLFNRDVASANFTYLLGAGACRTTQVWFRGWTIEDSGVFALRRQVELESRIKALYGMTTGIDLSRPTQD